jgi:hypothetical protein
MILGKTLDQLTEYERTELKHKILHYQNNEKKYKRDRVIFIAFLVVSVISILFVVFSSLVILKLIAT